MTAGPSRAVDAASDVLLAAYGVAKHWDASSGLAPVDLAVARGEVVALRGRSGSGKSTLIAVLAGWCAPDAGNVVRAAELDDGDTWMRWQGIAIVPQVMGLVEELSIGENVDLVLRLAGVARAHRRSIVSHLLDRLDLSDHADRLPRETSLGQQQRVAVARAVVGAPIVVLADEPTCHQDGAHASDVLAVLRGVADAGGGVLVASHDDVVADSADRVVSLDD